jgi:hypothetical protein
MVLPDENPRELAELQEGLIAELRPKGILQREIVARIAANIWRLRRIGYVTADYADDLRHLRRTAELDHYMELRKMEKTATPQERHGITCSMSRSGDCYDNAAMESFFKTFKSELVYQEHYATRKEAEASIYPYIELFYNRQRLHSSLGYRSPAEYEAQLG